MYKWASVLNYPVNNGREHELLVRVRVEYYPGLFVMGKNGMVLKKIFKTYT